MTDIVLWFDTETAGPSLPDAACDTVLEAAWCFTRRYPGDLRFRDLDDWQLTPLRSRFTALTPKNNHGLTDHRQPRATGSGGIEWGHDTGHVQKRMHAESGLDVAYTKTSRDLIVDHGRELDRLIVDDLHRAVAAVGGRLAHGGADSGGETEPVTVYLGGDGIGHYDRALVNRECDRVARHLHYRPVDISVAVQTLSEAEDSPTRALMALDDSIRADFVRALSGLDIDESARTVAGGIAWWLDIACVDPHRAAPDVVRSMLAYLTGRYRVGQALSTVRPY